LDYTGKSEELRYMSAGVEFYSDADGKDRLEKDFGSCFIGKTRIIYIKNTGDKTLTNVWIQTITTNVRYGLNTVPKIESTPTYFKYIDIKEIAPGEIKPALEWSPPQESNECVFEGNIVVHAIEKRASGKDVKKENEKSLTKASDMPICKDYCPVFLETNSCPFDSVYECPAVDVFDEPNWTIEQFQDVVREKVMPIKIPKR
jgi:hypothetical protein